MDDFPELIHVGSANEHTTIMDHSNESTTAIDDFYQEEAESENGGYYDVSQSSSSNSNNSGLVITSDDFDFTFAPLLEEQSETKNETTEFSFVALTNNNNNSTNTTKNNSTSSDDDEKTYNDAQILRNTFRVYGSLILVVFVAFCWLRLRFTRAYNLRKAQTVVDPQYYHRSSSTSPALQTHLAMDMHGYVSWIWKLFYIEDETFVDECGMDAWGFVRICYMGYRMTLMGMFVAIWLCPTYSTAQDDIVNDPVARLTTANLPDGSPRLVATVVATYMVVFHTMYMILNELEVFTTMRHRFLQQPKPRNYAVYLRNIPEGFQSNTGMRKFFEESLQGFKVQEAHICLVANNLQEQTTKRDETIRLLEHAVAEHDEFGRRPTHKVDRGLLARGLAVARNDDDNDDDEVDSINYYAAELKQMNKEISEQIDKLQEIAEGQPDNEAFSDNNGNGAQPQMSSDTGTSGFRRFVQQNTTDALANAVRTSYTITNEATNLVSRATNKAGNLVGLTDDEDGEVLSAGFVEFQKLSTVNAALQMIHHEKPYAMEVIEAPDPDDIFWKNVGRKHKDLEIGRLISLGATAAICLFWTVPTGFVGSISSVHDLRETFGFVDTILEAVPILAPILEVLAPQFLVILNAMLPVILTWTSTFEGAISGALVEASLFVKLSAFMIIQTFFVSAISGSFAEIAEKLEEIAEKPAEVIGLLATSLPTRSSFFMQYAFARTTTTFVMEGTGIIRLVKALVRRYVGPKLTDRERKMPVYGLTPLSEPPDFKTSDYMSNLVLLFIVYLVYAAIAPLVSFIICFCFIIQGVLFRHQFIYIYQPKPDSGGMLWMNFIRLLTTCLFIGEITISGLMALKQGVIAVPLMIPLIIVTVLFSIYIRREHFLVATRLPTRLCLQQDQNTEHWVDYSFLSDAYLQPEMCEKGALPNIPKLRLRELGLGGDEEDELGIPSSTETATAHGNCRVTHLYSRSYNDSLLEAENRYEYIPEKDGSGAMGTTTSETSAADDSETQS